ncbi:MOB kinase activator-like 3 [Lucilia cuprina]|nr:MOB kinase activator-like 3 [Lucilia cuprina]
MTEAKKKQTILPSPIAVNDVVACIDTSSLLENTASRIVSDFSEDQLSKIHNCDIVLIIGNSFEDIWINTTPGSKNFCRPIGFEYIKESKKTTKDLVEYLKDEINALEPICIKIKEFYINVSYQLSLTMIDGKISNAITEISSFWRCSICNEKKSQFVKYKAKQNIRLNIEVCQRNLTKSTKNNEELKELRAAEKSRIQEEFKVQMGLNIDNPLPSCGSTNYGNTARSYKKPTALPAPKYIELLMDWIESQINNESIFPVSTDVPFPKTFPNLCRKILTRLFRQ